MAERRYLRPALFDHVFNALVAGLTRLGLSLYGSRLLAVPGRKSGIVRTVPVNVLARGGARYLVAPRGETEWVRNLRAHGRGELRLGRECEPFVASELLNDAEKVPVLRAYVEKWWFEVGRFFDISGPYAADGEIERIATQHPVFRIEAPPA